MKVRQISVNGGFSEAKPTLKQRPTLLSGFVCGSHVLGGHHHKHGASLCFYTIVELTQMMKCVFVCPFLTGCVGVGGGGEL